MNLDVIKEFKERHNYTDEQVIDALRFLEDDGMMYNHIPVSVREFVESPEYLNAANIIYPEVMKALIEINEGGPYFQALLTGGIGCAKTTIAVYTQAIQLYRLSCYVNPHKAFDLDPTSEIEIVFQSLNEKLAKAVDYARFKALIIQAPYFNQHFRFDRSIESEMRFPNRIIVKPVAGIEAGAIGQNVIGGAIDEVNFMEVIENSDRSHDGGVYDQASSLHNAISRRRETRFRKGGEMPGMLCLLSSKRYPGEFTDKIIEQAKDPEARIFVYDKRVWDIKPKGTFGEERFQVFIGNETQKPRILEEDEEHNYLADEVIDVPLEYRREFENDLLNALRDIAGVGTFALHPFIFNKDKVAACFGRVKSVLSRDWTDFKTVSLKAYSSRFLEPKKPRWVHMDLAITGDSAGLACGYCKGFQTIVRGASLTEVLPVFHIDFILEVRPPKNDEISYERIRSLLYNLSEMGLNIKWASADSFQSTDMLQILRQQMGLSTGVRSMDATTIPYDVTKTALLDGRVWMQDHPLCMQEFTRLERDPKTNKIDHPKHGSKDCSDAVAGVVHALTMRRETWVAHGIPVSNIPDSVITQLQKEKE